jgi:type IV secretory pathway VirB2 component (pilin)
MANHSDFVPETTRVQSSGRSRFGDQPRTVRIGFVLFGVGLVFLAATIIPFFWGDQDRSVWLNVGCMLAPLGFVVAVTGVIRAGRADQRAALDQIKRGGIKQAG